MNILRQRIGKSYLCMIPIKKSQNNFNLVKTLSINSSTTVTSPATAAFESNSGYNTHFMRTNTKHPLKILKRTDQDYDISMGDHTGRLQVSGTISYIMTYSTLSHLLTIHINITRLYSRTRYGQKMRYKK